MAGQTTFLPMPQEDQKVRIFSHTKGSMKILVFLSHSAEARDRDSIIQEKSVEELLV